MHRHTPIKFDRSSESVQFNSGLLKASDLDLEKFLAKHQDTTLNFGSEFRPLASTRYWDATQTLDSFPTSSQKEWTTDSLRSCPRNNDRPKSKQ